MSYSRRAVSFIVPNVSFEIYGTAEAVLTRATCLERFLWYSRDQHLCVCRVI